MYNPPPKRKMAYPIMIMDVTSDDGLVLEIFSIHLLSENDAVAVFLLALLDIFCFLTVD